MSDHLLSQLAGRRILLLNWRDLGHPQAGGAEAYCQEVGERFATAGADVTLVTAAFRDAPVCEVQRGVRILRRGGTFGVYAWAAEHLLRSRLGRAHYDAVLDFQNGIPFFAPLFAEGQTAVVCVIHHVHQHQFAMRFPWPLSRLGQWLEGPASRRVYRDRPIVAVSASTRTAVRRQLRFASAIHVVPNGVTPADPPTGQRSPTPVIGCVTRLVPQKRLHLLVESVPALLGRFPELVVEVAGDGPERPRLEETAARLGVAERVHFHGRVDDATRTRLLSRAWLTVAPSVTEGWGLTIVEANALGLPAVAYPVPGLKDSVRHEHTGWLVEDGAQLWETISAALARLADPGEAARMSGRCRAWAARFSWDTSADRLAGVVLTEMERLRQPRERRRPAPDLAVVAHLHTQAGGVAAAELGAALTSRLRRTDEWHVDDFGFRVVMHGVDEIVARRVLHRLEAGQDLHVSLARPSDLLAAGIES